jgi:hypothetical protein
VGGLFGTGLALHFAQVQSIHYAACWLALKKREGGASAVEEKKKRGRRGKEDRGKRGEQYSTISQATFFREFLNWDFFWDSCFRAGFETGWRDAAEEIWSRCYA